jgi:anti-anti-sigma factor
VTDEPVPGVERHDSVSVVAVDGEIGTIQAQELRDRLFRAVRNRDLGLVLDLSGATYIDSVGVSLLFELADKLGERQLETAVVMPEEGLVRRVLTIVNLESVASVHPTVEKAVGAIEDAG